MINSADIGNYLYLIILGILMIVGLFEKVAKAKRPPAPLPPHPYDDFEAVDDHQQQQQPQTLEDLMRRMMQTQTVEAPKKENVSKMPVKDYYQPIKIENLDKQFPEITIPDDVETGLDFEFDIRQAIISNEILNRKY